MILTCLAVFSFWIYSLFDVLPPRPTKVVVDWQVRQRRAGQDFVVHVPYITWDLYVVMDGHGPLFKFNNEPAEAFVEMLRHAFESGLPSWYTFRSILIETLQKFNRRKEYHGYGASVDVVAVTPTRTFLFHHGDTVLSVQTTQRLILYPEYNTGNREEVQRLSGHCWTDEDGDLRYQGVLLTTRALGDQQVVRESDDLFPLQDLNFSSYDNQEILWILIFSDGLYTGKQSRLEITEILAQKKHLEDFPDGNDDQCFLLLSFTT